MRSKSIGKDNEGSIAIRFCASAEWRQRAPRATDTFCPPKPHVTLIGELPVFMVSHVDGYNLV